MPYWFHTAVIITILNAVMFLVRLPALDFVSILVIFGISFFPLLFLHFPEHIADWARMGFFERFASDYDQGIPPMIIQLLGWIIIILIFLALLFIPASPAA